MEEEEEEDQIDWDTLFDFDPTPIDSNSNNQSPLSVDDIEQFLLNDDVDLTGDFCQGFVNEILLDSPLENENNKSGEVVDGSDSSEELKQINNNNSDADDALDKKRKRQLRNKDAALRSRERKKMHVKDLEMKSKYYEAECKRLGSLLQWYMAENQALRFSLHSGGSSSNASMTKQESAVLLLESLLLGSLLWLMAAVVVLPGLLLLALQQQSQSQLETVVEGKHLPNLALRKGVSRSISFGKRFKASRSRMRRFLQNVLPVF